MKVVDASSSAEDAKAAARAVLDNNEGALRTTLNAQRHPAIDLVRREAPYARTSDLIVYFNNPEAFAHRMVKTFGLAGEPQDTVTMTIGAMALVLSDELDARIPPRRRPGDEAEAAPRAAETREARAAEDGAVPVAERVPLDGPDGVVRLSVRAREWIVAYGYRVPNDFVGLVTAMANRLDDMAAELRRWRP
jgi:hypothetical protein